MTPEQALNQVANALAQLSIPLAQHHQLQECVRILVEAIKKPSEEPGTPNG